MRAFLAAHGVTSGSNSSNRDKLYAILEAVTVTFLFTFIPKMIALGRPPTSILDIWEPFLTSALMGLYTYARLRGIEIPSVDDDQ